MDAGLWGDVGGGSRAGRHCQGTNTGVGRCPVRLKTEEAWVADLVAQSCPTLYDPMDCSLPGSSVHGISQARIQEWVVVPSSRGSSPPRDQTHVS